MAYPPRGTTFGDEFLARYEILATLGHGMSGAVFLARQKSLDRQVAVKYLGARIADEAKLHARFVREARVLTSLIHANVIRLLDFGFDGDHPYLVQELIEGEPLEQLLEAERPLPWPRVHDMARQCVDGLAAVHDIQVLHRDIKPANIMIRADGTVVLIDFGLATGRDADTVITATGFVVGTPLYMAPEILRGETATVWSDLYGLGMTFYQMATGRLPVSFRDSDFYAHRLANPPAPLDTVAPAAVPHDFCALVDAMLAVAPDDRPPSARAVAQTLAHLGRVNPSVAIRTTPATVSAVAPEVPTRRHLLPAVVALAVVLVVLAAALIRRRPPEVRPPAGPIGLLTVRARTSVALDITVTARAAGTVTVVVRGEGTATDERRLTGQVAPDAPFRWTPFVAAGRSHHVTAYLAGPPPETVESTAVTSTADCEVLCGGKDAIVPSNASATLADLVRQRRLSCRIQVACCGSALACPTRRGGLLCFAVPSGRLRWQRPDLDDARACAAASHAAYTLSSAGDVTALDWHDGSTSWQNRPIDDPRPELLADDRTVIVASDRVAVVLDGVTGSELWRSSEGALRPTAIAPSGTIYATAFPVGAISIDPRTTTSRPLPLVGNDFVTSPVLPVGDELFVGILPGLIIGGPPIGPRRLSVSIQGEPRALAGGTDVVIVLSNAPPTLVAVDRSTGCIRWTTSLPRPAAPRLYCDDGVVAVVYDKWNSRREIGLFALDSGAPLAVLDRGTPYMTLPTAGPGGLYFTADEGALCRFALPTTDRGSR